MSGGMRDEKGEEPESSHSWKSFVWQLYSSWLCGHLKKNHCLVVNSKNVKGFRKRANMYMDM